jgi:hypothetical protein
MSEYRPCFCCGEEDSAYEGWGQFICIDCNDAECTDEECKAPIEAVMIRRQKEREEEDNASNR